MLDISVVIPTHDPHRGRLRRTLSGLRDQNYSTMRWETLLVDNASSPPLDLAEFADVAPPNLRAVQESKLGLTTARLRGINEASAPVIVFVDDDNVLAPDYLAHVYRLFGLYPWVGAFGGRSLPEFEKSPAPWHREFLPLLALRDPSDKPRFSCGLRAPGARQDEYPADVAPIGAGMAIRREAAEQWAADSASSQFSDRRGNELTSGGDNDIVLTIMRHGWEVAYFPELSLAHLIPAGRLDAEYLARLNRGIQKSWMQVLAKHNANPRRPIAPWTVLPRKVKAFFMYRAWRGAVEYVRWQGACGQFEGLSIPAPVRRQS